MTLPVQPAAPAPAEVPGYIEQGVVWLRDCVIDLFNRIYECVRRALGYAPPAAPPAPPNPRDEHQQFLNKMAGLEPWELIEAFDKYFPKDSVRRKWIYAEIGTQKINEKGMFEKVEDLGERLSFRDPNLLRPFLDRAAAAGIRD